MNDERIKEAQRLFWQVETLRSLDVPLDAGVIIAKLQQMARLHEEIAMDLLGRQDPDGWIDLFAAITARGKAGDEAEARRLLRFGEQAAQREEDDREVLLSELSELSSWLGGLPIVPATEEAGRPKPKRRPPPLAARRPREWAC